MNWLIGDKVELRPVEPEDVDLLLKWENNRENWQLSGTLLPFSRDLMKRYVENTHLSIYQAGQLRLMIQLKASQRTIGTLDLFDFEPFHKRVGVGILIAETEFRNSGLASQSLSLVKAYCFDHLDLNQIFCNVLAQNKSSLKLFEKAGFEITGCKKQWVKESGGFQDEYFLQLIRER